MAGRIRSIKPELLEDGKTASLPDRAFRVFIGMLLLADDHGNLRADSNYLAGAITFGIGGTSRETEEALAELSSRGLARVYEVRNQRYASIVNWTKHQKVDHPSKPRVPTPNDEGVLILDDPREKTRRPSREDSTTLAPDLRPPTSDPDPDPEGDPYVDSETPRTLSLVSVLKAKPSSANADPTQPIGDYVGFVSLWDRLYQERTGGKKPTWGPKQGAMVKRLLKLPGGFEEAATRATRLMRNTPKFLNGTVPDLATLVQHYDKLVADSSSLSNWDLRSMADELERQGR